MADAPQNSRELFDNLGEQFKVPAFDMAQIMDHHQKNLDAMIRSWQAMVGGAAEVAGKQRQFFAAAVVDVTEMVNDYKLGGSPQEAALAMAKQAKFAKKAIEATITNTRDIAELVQKSSTEAFKIVQDRMKESYEEIGAGLEKKL
jgi:phasin family protein